MAVRTLDISALTCPMTWVLTKLELERMSAGEALEVRCGPGEALESVPRSALEAGYGVTVEGTTIRIVVSEAKPVTSAERSGEAIAGGEASGRDRKAAGRGR
jgi:TusA-related sulfurtransferase